MEISPRLTAWIDATFPDGTSDRVLEELRNLPIEVLGGQDPERIQAALVLTSNGSWYEFTVMRDLLAVDFRDLLVNADLAGADWEKRLPARLDLGSAWGLNDAVVLVGVAMSGRHTLRSIVQAVDAANHDVLPYTEFSGALGRLVASGLVSHDSDKFTLTRAGRKVYSKRRGGHTQFAREIQPALGKVKRRVPGEPVVTPVEYESAVASYLGHT